MVHATHGLAYLFKLVQVSASLVKVVRSSRQGEVPCREAPPFEFKIKMINTAISDERLQQYMGGRYGQRGETRERYREAVEACESVLHLDKTTSEIARMHGHHPETFRMMMKRHFSDILERREKLRMSLGYVKTPHFGPKKSTEDKYAPALELLRKSNMTVAEAARQTGVELASLQQHILFHHRDLADERLHRRLESLDKPRERGKLNGAGRMSGPRGTASEYYAKAVRRCKRHPEMTIKEIATKCGLEPHSLSCYLQRWHRDVLQLREEYRRGEVARRQAERAKHNEFTTKAAKAQRKYAPALPLIEKGMSYEAAAQQSGLDRDQLLSWVKHNRPDLHILERQNNWVTLPNGVRVSRKSWDKFQQAAQEYATTDRLLKDIAASYELKVNSLLSFLRRTMPQAVEKRREKRDKK